MVITRCAALSATLALTTTLTVAPQAAHANASPNAVVVWDSNAQTAIWDVAQQAPPQVAGRGFAMVSGAVYDAVNAIAGTPYRPYLGAPRANGRESADAAVGTAAYQVLDAIFPAQEERLRTQYDEWLAGIPDGPAKRGGLRVGAEAAAAMITARRDDGAFDPRPWTVGTEPGQYRPTPPGFENTGAWVGFLKPFAVPDATEFRTPGPPSVTSRAFTRDFAEVKRLGSKTSTVRTADQTEAALWWHDRRSVSWGMKRDLAVTQRLSVLETARFYALADFTGTDGAIACANDKEFWHFWRPVTAIRTAGTDGNPATTPDPGWTPLVVTPPNPDYPSGHTCRTAAQMTAYARFFGRDRVPFSAFSVDSGTTRHFGSFSQATAEVVEARIWAGIHFRSADVDGTGLGTAVGNHITKHYFQPRR
ncbi:vanadium-dependent haloperoxidase [Amycolatopsis sp. A133]|uniref:vanadium-dependent haloperoxidase n=1 Tax=Amycolatopsis sp. A133 TaxID=3064472 RepID=UPI0027F93FAE|nr:vanadium-dependent haloperoxidase [Amycolatopsis sp. A133]MDQ7808659.1 vanadium-dependent haloperoxidase [Amycolatopsis sp. A133]